MASVLLTTAAAPPATALAIVLLWRPSVRSNIWGVMGIKQYLEQGEEDRKFKISLQLVGALC